MTTKLFGLVVRILFGLFFVAPAAPAMAADPPKLAIKGYDPVAYFTEQRPVQGRPEFAFVWDGLRYQFASAANRDRFVAEPDRYAPNYAGHCAGSLAARGEQVPADPLYWLITGGKLYVFAGPRGEELIRKNLSLLKDADANWAAIKKAKE